MLGFCGCCLRGDWARPSFGVVADRSSLPNSGSGQIFSVVQGRITPVAALVPARVSLVLNDEGYRHFYDHVCLVRALVHGWARSPNPRLVTD